MVKIVTREYIDSKYNSKTRPSMKYPTTDPIISDKELMDVIGMKELSINTITDLLNTTTHTYKRVGYCYLRSKILRMCKNKTLTEVHTISGTLYKNSKNYNPPSHGFKAYLTKYAPNIKKLIVR